MIPETHKALKESIAHWERMRDDPDCGEKPSPDDCPLCGLFFVRPSVCGADCPVQQATAQEGCEGTPYDDAATAFFENRDNDNTGASLQAWGTAAQAEIDFLTSLLPEEG